MIFTFHFLILNFYSLSPCSRERKQSVFRILPLPTAGEEKGEGVLKSHEQ